MDASGSMSAKPLSAFICYLSCHYNYNLHDLGDRRLVGFTLFQRTFWSTIQAFHTEPHLYDAHNLYINVDHILMTWKHLFMPGSPFPNGQKRILRSFKSVSNQHTCVLFWLLHSSLRMLVCVWFLFKDFPALICGKIGHL